MPLLLMFIPIALGLFVRYKPVSYWQQHHDLFYVEDRPIFTGYDSYLYARLAEDYKLGVFQPKGIDRLRFVPDYMHYYPVIPFYSWLFAKLSTLTGKHIENLSFWLIPLFAVLFVIPFVILFYSEALPFTALLGALIGSISLMYLVRTALNRLDTDSIILFSFFSIPMAVYLAANSQSLRKKYLYLLLLAVFVNLFYWGYYHTGLILVLWVFSTIYWLYPHILKVLREKKFHLDKQTLLDLGLLTLAFNPYFLLNGIGSLLYRIEVYILGFGKPEVHNFPDVFISISELQKLSFSKLALFTVGSKVLLILAVIGLAVFIALRFRTFLLILPVFLVGLITLKGESRFAMYLAPVLGIGFGFLIDLLWNFIKRYLHLEGIKKHITFGGLALILTAIVVYANKEDFKYVPIPIMNSHVAKAFIELGKQTPPNAWIYTWWDYGYAIQYYSRRATFHDGGSQHSPKTYFIALGFTTPSQEKAFNITKTLTVCGAKCIDKLLKEGKSPQEIKRLFESGALIQNKTSNHPVYWAFTKDLLGKFYWISYFGSWNFATLKGEHSFISPTYCVLKEKDLYLCKSGPFLGLLDIRKFVLKLSPNRILPVKYFAVRTPDQLKVFENKYSPYGLAFERVYTYKRDFYAWYFTNTKGFKSNFNKMFPLRVWDKKYFKKIKEKFPDYTFYLVR